MGYLDLPIEKIHEALVAKKTTPLELVRESLKRAKENTDNAFELLLEEEAIAMAESLDEPETDNLLWGIPYCAKDNLSTKGIVTTGGSDSLNGYCPLYDATVIAKLHEKKAILIGKTTLDELAMGATGTSGHKGATYNPYDPSHHRMIGGSSCGSAAVVAAGIVPFALGSDTGDSVRKPASYSGTIGVKPTWGRISRYGLFPFAPSMDHIGYFTRYNSDAAILLSVLAGHDENDATSSSKPVENYHEASKNPLPSPRIAILQDIVDCLHDETVKSAFERAVEHFASLGAHIERVHLGTDILESVYPTYVVLSSAEATSNDANIDGFKFGPCHEGADYREAMKSARTKGFSELIRRRFVIGGFALMDENREALFLKAQKNRAKIVQYLRHVFEKNDLILAPATPSIAPFFEDKRDRLCAEYLVADSHLILGNFAGLPSIVLPLGFENGMPFGINAMGRAFEEGNLFSFGEHLEQWTGYGGISTRGGPR